jgi:hypothetical protein
MPILVTNNPEIEFRHAYYLGYEAAIEEFVDRVEDDKMTPRAAYEWLFTFCHEGSLKRWAFEDDPSDAQAPPQS